VQDILVVLGAQHLRGPPYRDDSADCEHALQNFGEVSLLSSQGVSGDRILTSRVQAGYIFPDTVELVSEASDDDDEQESDLAATLFSRQRSSRLET